MTLKPSFARVTLLCSTILILGCASSARASSFSVSSIGVFNIVLTSPGFGLTANGQTGITQIPAQNFLGPGGSLISFSGSPFLSASDFNTGSVLVNGTSYPVWFNHFPPAGYVSLTIDMHISTGTVMVPLSTDPTIVLTAPLTLTVSARGRNSNFSEVFSAGFYGSGIATVTLTHQPQIQPGAYHTQSISYQFNAVPTPEPTTLILLGSGIFGIVGAKLRKRH